MSAEPPRRRLTPKEYRTLLQAQGGKCCVQDCESLGPFEQEHSTPHAWERGAKPDQLMCVPHHRKKTRQDRKNIAKVNRLKRQQSEGRSRPRRGKPIASRGFQKPTGKRKWPQKRIDPRQLSPPTTIKD